MNINGGWLSKPVKPIKSGFTLEFGLVAMGTNLNEDERNFTLNGTFRFDKSQAEKLTQSISNPAYRPQIVEQIIKQDFDVIFYGPSITGSSGRNIQVYFAGGQFNVSDPKYPVQATVDVPSQNIDLGISGYLSSLTLLPAAAPQIKVGTIYGTQAIVRFVPSISLPDDFGKLNFFGFGLQHNPNVWFDIELPVDVNLGFLTQKISVESVLDITTLSYGLNVSKTLELGWISFTPYAGYLMETSKVDVSYSQSFDTATGKENVDVNFSLDGINKSRLLVGLNLQVSVLNLNFDYNIGKINSMTAGLSFSF
jgi:hypothetical protein